MKLLICFLAVALAVPVFGQSAKPDPLTYKTPSYDDARKFTNDMDAFISSNAAELAKPGQGADRVDLANSFLPRAEKLFGATVFSRKFASCIKAAGLLRSIATEQNMIVNSTHSPKSHQVSGLVRYAVSYGDEYRQCRIDSEMLADAKKN